MGNSISKERTLIAFEESLRIIKPLLGKEKLNQDSNIWSEIQTKFLLPINYQGYLDDFVFKNVTPLLFKNNIVSGNVRSLTLFFLGALSDFEKEISTALDRVNTPNHVNFDQINNLLSIGMVIRLIFIHYLSHFSFEDFVKSVEHKPLADFIEKLNGNSDNFQFYVHETVNKIQNCYPGFTERKYDTLSCFIIYIIVSTNNKFGIVPFTDSNTSVFGQIFTKIPSFLITSQKYIDKLDSNIELNNIINILQATLVDILLTLFSPKEERENIFQTNNFNIDTSPLITAFHLLSSPKTKDNIIYCDEESDHLQNTYQFFEFLIKKILGGGKNFEFKLIRKKSVELLTLIIFVPSEINTNIYYDIINNVSDPRFLPNIPDLSTESIQIDCDSDNSISGFSFFPYFEQIYRSIICDKILINESRTVLLIYSLVHSNPHFISYCLSKSDVIILFLSILESINKFSEEFDHNGTIKLIMLLSILIRFTNDENLCRLIHRTTSEYLPEWVEDESLRKLFNWKREKNFKVDIDISSNENIISIGNVVIIVLLKILFQNYRKRRDVFLCCLLGSIVSNLSINIENYHWYTGEKLIHYIFFLNNQLYCSFNTFDGDANDVNFCNRFSCGLIMLKVLLLLLTQGLRNDYILSNIQLIYVLLRVPFLNKISKFHALLRKYIGNSFLSENVPKTNAFGITNEEVLGTILTQYNYLEDFYNIFVSDLLNLENTRFGDHAFDILNFLKDLVISKYSSNSTILKVQNNKAIKYKRLNCHEFNFISPIFCSVTSELINT
ncbi:hypothetical protein FG379_000701 [Cryptosporidium bovis]|uniref:uncharacterized protein n=1 Tax=Cryptosporidium bovis TaxID=310047 RepID=UPI00351A4163|nr:hypothetical protein FG379_000701 [Cryptosporidium bovis]